MINQLLSTVTDTVKNLWYRDPAEEKTHINDRAVRIRAGMLMIIPVYMLFTLYDALFISHWVVDGNTAVDLGDTDWDDNIIYQVEAIKKVYDYSFQSWVLVYAFLEMTLSMWVTTSRLSPTILLASFLAKNEKPVWKPLVPKRFAWTIGASLITVCWVFFNPDVFANFVNWIWGDKLLPTTYNYMPYWIPFTMVWVCLIFMWLEAVLGFCVGCKIHALLVKMKVIEEECEACNNIDWDEIARKNKERLAKEAAAKEADRSAERPAD